MNDSGLRVVQLNVCRDTPTALDFVLRERDNHDVFCLQEVLKPGHKRLEPHFHSKKWIPMTRVNVGGEWVESGIGLYSNIGPVSVEFFDRYYVGHPDRMENLDDAPGPNLYERIHATKNRILLGGDFTKNGITRRIFTTHFDWVSDGNPSDQQWSSAAKLLALLDELGEFTFTADCNFPRDKEIWKFFMAHGLHYPVPEDIQWTLDPSIHKLGEKVKDLKIMVDHIFHTLGVQVTDVRTRFGLSDHGALLFTVL